MGGHCSTGQNPQWAVVPMEEEGEEEKEEGEEEGEEEEEEEEEEEDDDDDVLYGVTDEDCIFLGHDTVLTGNLLPNFWRSRPPDFKLVDQGFFSAILKLQAASSSEA